jgi:hypothetical protein
MWFFCRFEKASFPQENEKNNMVTLIGYTLISVAQSPENSLRNPLTIRGL